MRCVSLTADTRVTTSAVVRSTCTTTHTRTAVVFPSGAFSRSSIGSNYRTAVIEVSLQFTGSYKFSLQTRLGYCERKSLGLKLDSQPHVVPNLPILR